VILPSRFALRSFRHDESGVVAVIFALALIPLFLMGGAATDLATAVRRKTILQGAVDATALDAARGGFEQDEAALTQRAQTFFAAVAHDPDSTMVSARIERRAGKLNVCVVASAVTQTQFMRIAGLDTVTVGANSCATAGSASFEIALALDTSGSMAGVKLSSLQSAAKTFVDKMFGPTMTGASVRMAIVPFNHNVAVDPGSMSAAATPWADWNAASPQHWNQDFWSPNGRVTSRFDVFARLRGLKSSYAWKGCFQALPYTQETAASTADPASLLVPSLEPDSPDPTRDIWGRYNYSESVNDYLSDSGPGCGAVDLSSGHAASRSCKYAPPKAGSLSAGSGPNTACGSKPLQRLTDSSTTLKTKIDQLTAAGSTNIHQGVWWAWNAISPVAAFKDGAAYDKEGNQKVVVLMSDGDNTWFANTYSKLFKSDYSAYGYYTTVGADNRHVASPPTLIDGAPLGGTNGDTPALNERNAKMMMDDLARRTCANLRAAGVTVFTIAFEQRAGDISAEGKKLLQDCAGDPSRYFVADTATISTVFGSIASAIGKLRLSE
jgi:Flp pilus assembly protein TadG